MSYAKSRNQRSRKEEAGYRNWRSPHHTPNTERERSFRLEQGGSSSRRELHGHDGRSRESDRPEKYGTHRTTRYRESSSDNKSHRWSYERRVESRMDHPNVYSSDEFPALGARKTDPSRTPDPVRLPRQNCVSKSNMDWATQIDHFENEKERALRDMIRYKRRLLMSESSDGSSEDQENLRVDMNAKPRKEYETDEAVIMRRQKQIDYGKNTLGYDSYLSEVPKHRREKQKHVVTPNKFQKCSRRAWDGLVRQWRRKLHEYDPEGTYKPEKVARKELHFSDTVSEATSESSSGPEPRMDIDLNQSISSTVSDYLASNESSRPETPDEPASRPETPTIELEGLTVNDQMNGNYYPSSGPVTVTSKIDLDTPDATLTPAVTPAENGAEGQIVMRPSDLIAALHHVAAVVGKPELATDLDNLPMNMPPFHSNNHCLPPQLLNSDLKPHFPPNMPGNLESFHHSHDNVNTNMSKNGDIFDNFNLDDCFLTENDDIC